jgi:hypothetical protein
MALDRLDLMTIVLHARSVTQMRYIDSGTRDPSQALGSWLSRVLQADVTELRWQSGFFAGNGLGLLQESLERLGTNDQVVRAVIGSNDQCTSREDVDALLTLMRLPRSRADLGVVSYAGAYFHPKTVHVCRQDGSQAAYVGSANLTESGVSSLHVEAGITLDTRDGDAISQLDEIKAAIDFWFQTEPPGLYRIRGPEDVDTLVNDGIIGVAPLVTPKTTPSVSGSGTSTTLARLRPLIKIPVIKGVPEPAVEITRADVERILSPATPRPDFPSYLLFSPGQTTPTEGVTALSGSALPNGVAGLIVRLNLDTSRHFAGGSGTANISIPVATLATFRFGIQAQGYARPRAEFALRLRYISDNNSLSLPPTRTNIMAYGFMPGETGHGDVRMLVPAAVKRLAQAIKVVNAPLPEVGHVAFLEWPTMNNLAEFRITFLDPRLDLFRQAEGMLQEALATGLTVGDGACWLPNELSPHWVI